MEEVPAGEVGGAPRHHVEAHWATRKVCQLDGRRGKTAASFPQGRAEGRRLGRGLMCNEGEDDVGMARPEAVVGGRRSLTVHREEAA